MNIQSNQLNFKLSNTINKNQFSHQVISQTINKIQLNQARIKLQEVVSLKIKFQKIKIILIL